MTGKKRKGSAASVGALFTVLLCLSLPGCGYYSFSPAVTSEISTIAVPILANETLEFGVEQDLTAALVNEFTENNALRVVKEEGADSILRGAVVLYERPVVSYDAGGNPIEYKVRVVADLTYENLKKNEIVWEGEVEGWAVYAPSGTGGDLRTEADAQEYAYQKLAQDVLARTVQGW